MKITVVTKEQAMDMAKTILGLNEVWQDDERTKRAGYPILVGGPRDKWISDLNDRLEVNDLNETLNIWIDPLKNLVPYQIEDALEIIDDLLYTIDDKFPGVLEDNTGMKEARKLIYGCYKQIKDIIDTKYPQECEPLIKRFNLNEA